MLTLKQRAFAEAYIELGNATKAAQKAGYSKKSAYSIGNDNLKKPEVMHYIAQRLASSDAEKIATSDEILRYLTAVMRGQEKDQFGLEASLDTRLKAADALMKRYNAADKGNGQALQKLDALLAEFRRAIYG